MVISFIINFGTYFNKTELIDLTSGNIEAVDAFGKY